MEQAHQVPLHASSRGRRSTVPHGAFPFPRGLLSFVKLIWLQILMALPQSPGGAGCSAACRGGVRSPEMFTAPIRAARVPLGTGQAQPRRANSSCPGLQ